MKTTRRGFLRNLSAGTVGIWLSPLVPWKAFAQESIRKPFDPHLKNHFLSVCRQCPQGCGVLAEVLEGKIKKLRGNPLHPTNRGTLCARGVSALQLYYGPDRIRGPLKRKGERGSGGWEPIGWDDALKSVSDKLVALRTSDKSHGFAMVVDQLGGLEGILARRFCRSFGTANYLDVGQYPDGAANAATLMQGLDSPALFDIRNASLLVSFGVPFLEASRYPLQTWRAFAEFRAGKGHPRGRFVHFSAVRDLTASKADEWIPIKPGTEGAVALGMAYVMLQEGLYNHEFVKFHCNGFEKRREGTEDFPGFRDYVTQNYKPAQVSEITGAPVEKIVGFAREFALARAPLALWQDQIGVAAQPLSAQMAIHSLNALVGNLDAPGGVLVARGLPDRLPAEVTEDAASRAGTARGSVVAADPAELLVGQGVGSIFPDRVVRGTPYPVEAAFIYRADPVFDQLNGAKFREALGKIGFSVAVASHHNDTTAMCDLVLPESHALESWYAGINFTQDGYPFFNVAEPVFAPRHDTRHVGDIFLALAKKCGGPVGQSLPWNHFREVAFAYLGQINAMKSGDLFGRPYQETWTRLLERIGWRARAEAPNAEFWQEALRTGGWWDPIYYHKEWDRSLKTKSKRFEFFPTALWEGLRRSRKGQGITDAEKAQILPHYEGSKAAGEKSNYPMTLLVYALPNLSQVESPNQPWLQEISGAKERESWTTWLDINPEEAHHHHLEERDEVWLESERGKTKLRCRFDHGVQPGTVRVSFGLGHVNGGRWMKGIGFNPAEVVTQTYDARVGTPNWQTTRVRIQKA